MAITRNLETLIEVQNLKQVNKFIYFGQILMVHTQDKTYVRIAVAKRTFREKQCPNIKVYTTLSME